LRETDLHNQIAPHLAAYFVDHIDGETGAFSERGAAVFIAAGVGRAPEELVDEVAVCAVQLHEVEAEFLGTACGATEGGNGVGDVTLGHCVAVALLGIHAFRGVFEGHWR